MPTDTLVKRLVAAGFGSRRACAALITAGRVRVNGEIAEAITRPVDDADVITVDGRRLRRPAPSPNVYLAVNKPRGMLSAVSDARGRDTVLSAVPHTLRRPGLVPAGRLDLNSEGLVLLTDDGALVHALTHPRNGVEKEYVVLLNAPLTTAQRERLVRGVASPDAVLRARSVEPLGGSRYRIVLTEGRKREIRAMAQLLDRRVPRLVRVRIGSLRLGVLKPGEWRPLTAAEVRGLRKAAGLSP